MMEDENGHSGRRKYGWQQKREWGGCVCDGWGWDGWERVRDNPKGKVNCSTVEREERVLEKK